MTSDAAAAQGGGTPGPGTPKQERPSLWKAYTAASGLIGTAGALAGFTGKTGFGAIFIVVIAFIAITVIILGFMAVYSYVKTNTTVRNRQVHITIPLAVGVSLALLAAGTGVAYGAAQHKQPPISIPPPTSTPASSGAPHTSASPPGTPPASVPATQSATHEPTEPSLTLTDPNSTNVVSEAFSPDGETVAVADVNGGAFLYSTATGDYLSALYSPNHQSLWSVAFSQNGTMLAIGTGRNNHWDDGSVYLWTTGAAPKLVASLKDPEGGLVGAAAFSPNGRFLVWSDNQGAVYVYNIAARTTQTLQPIAKGAGYGVDGLVFSPSGGLLAGSGSNGTTYVWTVGTWKPFGGSLSGPNNQSANGLAFSPDGTMLAVADSTGTVDLWSLASGQVSKVFRAPSGAALQDVVFTPDGAALIATASSGSNPHASTICAWNVATTRLIGRPLQDPVTDGLDRLAISPNGKTLAVGDGNAHTYLWNLNWLG